MSRACLCSRFTRKCPARSCLARSEPRLALPLRPPATTLATYAPALTLAALIVGRASLVPFGHIRLWSPPLIWCTRSTSYHQSPPCSQLLACGNPSSLSFACSICATLQLEALDTNCTHTKCLQGHKPINTAQSSIHRERCPVMTASVLHSGAGSGSGS